MKLTTISTTELHNSIGLFWTLNKHHIVSTSKAECYTTATLDNGKKVRYNNQHGCVVYTTNNPPRIERVV